MAVEARVVRAETAPEAGEVDEQVCSVESATDEETEYECEIENCDEEAIKWSLVHERLGRRDYRWPHRGRRR